ncbi:protein spinster homolog 1 [Eurytemora carolleeae]|uniref:protein spinster homolog 1 n=1 Tax=Eurytemora carolleeae TaxID=1294199 RepID=UPI000C790FF8|nr:protein spinster homolog 1 [Eurytemora carolleeae]|eukprot:XP_023345314.1 protein spinster homolog 1-like [Eurytemora affinis]
MDLDGTDLEGVPIHPDSVAFIFGAVLMVSGILGVLGGMTLSRILRPKYPKIDPLICGVSILISCPLLIWGLLSVKDNIILSFAIFTLGSTFLNMNWSISVDMSLYVIIPVRRSTAEAIHLMATHALGEAGAPYIIGLISDSIIKSSCPEDDQDCLDSSLSSYLGMQKALYLVFVLLVLGGILFILAALWIVPEKHTVDRLLEEQLEQLENKRREENEQKDIKWL